MTTTLDNPMDSKDSVDPTTIPPTTDDINAVETSLAKPATDDFDVEDIDDSKYAVPRGTMAFVLLLITFYILYWSFTWFEIFVMRGA